MATTTRRQRKTSDGRHIVQWLLQLTTEVNRLWEWPPADLSAAIALPWYIKGCWKACSSAGSSDSRLASGPRQSLLSAAEPEKWHILHRRDLTHCWMPAPLCCFAEASR